MKIFKELVDLGFGTIEITREPGKRSTTYFKKLELEQIEPIKNDLKMYLNQMGSSLAEFIESLTADQKQNTSAEHQAANCKLWRIETFI